MSTPAFPPIPGMMQPAQPAQPAQAPTPAPVPPSAPPPPPPAAAGTPGLAPPPPPNYGQPGQMGQMSGGGTPSADPNMIGMMDGLGDVPQIDPNAAATDRLPPPPAGLYRVTIGLPKDAPTFVWPQDNMPCFGAVRKSEKTGQTFLSAMIELTLSDPGKPWDGKTQMTNVNTYVGQTKSSSADDLLKALTGRPDISVQLNHVQKMRMIAQYATAGNAQVAWEADWEATKPVLNKQTGKTEYETIKRRMVNFPLENGVHQPLWSDPATGEECSTRLSWGAVHHVSRLAPGAGAGAGVGGQAPMGMAGGMPGMPGMPGVPGMPGLGR